MSSFIDIVTERFRALAKVSVPADGGDEFFVNEVLTVIGCEVANRVQGSTDEGAIVCVA